jgi:hypothetical protein
MQSELTGDLLAPSLAESNTSDVDRSEVNGSDVEVLVAKPKNKIGAGLGLDFM